MNNYSSGAVFFYALGPPFRSRNMSHGVKVPRVLQPNSRRISSEAVRKHDGPTCSFQFNNVSVGTHLSDVPHLAPTTHSFFGAPTLLPPQAPTSVPTTNFTLLAPKASKAPKAPSAPTALSIYTGDASSESYAEQQMRVDEYMRSHMIDAHLLFVQIARTFLMGFGLVAAIAGINASTDRHRIQCALSSAACFVSTFYYQRLHALRRLPVAMGYSLESNSVAEAMRYTNWTVAICLLGICAFLLRGPFATPTYGFFGWWEWSYETWRVAGPLMSSIGTAFGLPGWHSARAVRFHQLRGDTQSVVAYAVSCVLCLMVSCFTSLSTGSAVLSPFPDVAQRTDAEISFSRSISVLWFVYPLVSLVRTIAIVLGAGDWGDLHARNVEAHEASLMRRRTWRSSVGSFLVSFLHGFERLVRHMYLTFVAAPVSKSSLAIHHLHAESQHLLPTDGLRTTSSTATHTVPLYAPTDLLRDNDHEQHEWTTDPTQEFVHAHEGLMRIHIPEMTPLCSQGSDSIIAFVDIFSQAITALGCAILTLNDL